MTYDQLLDSVVNSRADDWNVIYCWGAHSGPSYRGLPPYLVEEAHAVDKASGGPMTTFTEHGMTAAYRPDLSVTLAWGITSNNRFQTDWATGFPDPDASSHIADLFYNGALVHRQIYVVVDGGRSFLPLPNKVGGTEVDQWDHDFVRLLDHLEIAKISEYDGYFQRSGLTVAS